MEAEVLTVLLGVALAALVAACGAGFRWMRSDFRDLRNHVDSRFADHTATTNAQFAAVDARFDRLENRFDRLEARFDELIMALARAGSLIDPQLASPRPSPVPPESEPDPPPPDPAPTPTEAPENRALPSEALEERALPSEALEERALPSDPPRHPPDSPVSEGIA